MSGGTPATVDLPLRRFDRGSFEERDDALVIEAPLEILLNSEPFSVTMRTPGQELALVRGLLFTEGVLSSAAPFPVTRTACERGPWPRALDLEVPPELLSLDGQERRLISASSCGLCGKKSWSPLEAAPVAPSAPATVSASEVLAMQERMRAKQSTFERSGGTHAAAAFDAQGQLLALAEDIGRHNAVDKVVGELLLSGRLEDAQTLTVSGRVSFEIVSKAAQASFALLIAVSAPSSLAVELAQQGGITLIAFCRQGRFNVYSHPERLKESPLGC